MDFALISRLIYDKLHDRTTYVLALVVGTLINAYGQLLVPWLRDKDDPIGAFMDEFDARPGLAAFSVFLGYAFPFCVGIYSAVVARYKLRRIESIADFPDRKPDPVFRATRDGAIVEIGSGSQPMFDAHGIDNARKIVGEEVWERICAEELAESGTKVFFDAEQTEFLVTYAPTDNDQFNVYLTRTGAKKG